MESKNAVSQNRPLLMQLIGDFCGRDFASRETKADAFAPRRCSLELMRAYIVVCGFAAVDSLRFGALPEVLRRGRPEQIVASVERTSPIGTPFPVGADGPTWSGKTGTSYLPEETLERAKEGNPIEKAKLAKDATSAFNDVYAFAAAIRAGEAQGHTHGAPPTPCAFPRCTAEPMHRVRHMHPTPSLAALAAQARLTGRTSRRPTSTRASSGWGSCTATSARRAGPRCVTHLLTYSGVLTYLRTYSCPYLCRDAPASPAAGS